MDVLGSITQKGWSGHRHAQSEDRRVPVCVRYDGVLPELLHTIIYVVCTFSSSFVVFLLAHIQSKLLRENLRSKACASLL